MKSFTLFPVLFFLVACSSGTPEYDATGTFEATDVVVSAEASGKILGLDVEEGTVLKAEQEAMSKKAAEKMFTELTKGQDVQHPTITAEQLTDAMLDSVSGMEGATPEALEQLRNGLLGILQSAAEQENAHEADE